ncbi:MAG TPA: hypothetical protein VMZ30_04040 [Pyrinomonadaceae bacterium]|nr:hypothetical protein [Pyrinomonadaceae bacterium]
MSIFRALELTGGIVTGVLAIACFFLLRPIQPEFRSYQDFLGWVLFYGLPGSILTAGAYLHSVKQKSWGLLLVLIVALLSAIFIFVSLFGGIFYWGVWTALFALAPSIMSIVTAAGGFATVISETPNQIKKSS